MSTSISSHNVLSNHKLPSSVNLVSKQQKCPKAQYYRCEICKYETNIARNLRIHMTSEKHGNNVLIMEQVRLCLVNIIHIL